MLVISFSDFEKKKNQCKKPTFDVRIKNISSTNIKQKQSTRITKSIEGTSTTTATQLPHLDTVINCTPQTRNETTTQQINQMHTSESRRI